MKQKILVMTLSLVRQTALSFYSKSECYFYERMSDDDWK